VCDLIIALGSDHAGFPLKEDIKGHLQQKGVEVKDYGCYSPESVDYPDIAEIVALAVVHGECDKGILICGTGIGVSIAANKVPGIRAALCGDTFSARAAAEHNDANIITLGQRVTGPGLAMDIVDAWLSSAFLGGRHKQRVDKITALDKKYGRCLTEGNR